MALSIFARCLALFIFLAPVVVFGQSNPLSKKMQQAVALYEKGKFTEADEYLVDVLRKNPEFGDGWDLLLALRGEEYQRSKKLRISRSDNKISITASGKDGQKLPSGIDSLTKRLESMMNGMDLSKMAWSKYLFTARKALLYSDDAYKSSIAWRMHKVDIDVDSNVNRKALKFYREAEEAFGEKNYQSAAQLYRRAINEQPDFYKAKLYLGDALYASENYSEALISFSEAVNQFPDLLEPRKYLVDAYRKLKLYDKAIDAGIAAMAVYPDISMVAKIEDAAYLLNKHLDIKWMPRGAFPNRIQPEATGLPDLNDYTEPESKKKLPAPWSHYINAMENAKPYCRAGGLFADTSALGDVRYLELFSWQEMLRKSNDASLAEARKMQDAGYLDCYVLVTCFHPDIYEQYLDFASKNKEKIARYYRLYLKSI